MTRVNWAIPKSRTLYLSRIRPKSRGRAHQVALPDLSRLRRDWRDLGHRSVTQVKACATYGVSVDLAQLYPTRVTNREVRRFPLGWDTAFDASRSFTEAGLRTVSARSCPIRAPHRIRTSIWSIGNCNPCFALSLQGDALDTALLLAMIEAMRKVTARSH